MAQIFTAQLRTDDDTSWQRSCYGWHFPDWFAVVGVRVKGEADSDWYLTARIHSGQGRQTSVLDISRI